MSVDTFDVAADEFADEITEAFAEEITEELAEELIDELDTTLCFDEAIDDDVATEDDETAGVELVTDVGIGLGDELEPPPPPHAESVAAKLHAIKK